MTQPVPERLHPPRTAQGVLTLYDGSRRTTDTAMAVHGGYSVEPGVTAPSAGPAATVNESGGVGVYIEEGRVAAVNGVRVEGKNGLEISRLRLKVDEVQP